MELKPRSDGRRTKASLPEKRVVAGRQSSAERCKANVSSLEPVSSSGTAEDENEASAGKRNSHNSHLENHTSKRKRKREINLSNQSRKRLVSGFKFPVMLTTKTLQRDQANKGTGWMPRRHLPKKDATNCEKPRGAVSGL